MIWWLTTRSGSAPRFLRSFKRETDSFLVAAFSGGAELPEAVRQRGKLRESLLSNRASQLAHLLGAQLNQPVRASQLALI